MMIRAASADELYWIAERTGLATTGEFRGILAETRDGRTVGMVGYDKWTHNAVRIHIAMDMPIRAFVQEAFAYPFEQANKEILLAEIAASNKKSRRLASRFGFREIYRIRDGWAKGDDLIIYELRRGVWHMTARKVK